MTERQVKPEGTDWRDKELSHRHRMWGWNVPMVDIDFLVVEYSAGKARALVEYKTSNVEINLENKSINALNDLADRANLPFFIVQYNKNSFNDWCVNPINQHGKSLLSKIVNMTELEFVSFLYQIRGFSFIPSDISQWIRNQHPFGGI